MSLLRRVVNKLRRRAPSSMFAGDFPSWEEAKANCDGYEAQGILLKVRDSLLQVKNGQAVYERDSVLFDSIEYAWPLLAALLRIGCAKGRRLSVLDFGGSLGSSYFQSRGFLSCLDSLQWSVVEQPHFVACGKEHFADCELSFHYSMEEAAALRQPDVLLLSSVMQYLPQPYSFAAQAVAQGFDYIVVDRTPFLLGDDGGYADTERLTVQTVPEWIYRASYPAWFFARERFVKAFSDRYDVVCGWQGTDQVSSPNCSFEGLLLKKKVP